MDVIAHDTGIDRVELRRQQLHPARRLPVPDAGRAAIRQRRLLQRRCDVALKTSDWDGFPARRAAAAAKGKLRGIGISTYVEACGIAPSRGGGLARRARRAVRGRQHPRASDRQRDRVHRHAQPRPGPRDHLRPARRRPARRADRRRSTSCMATPARSRSAWAPTAAAAWPSAARRWSRRWTRSIAKGKKIAAHLMEASRRGHRVQGRQVQRRRHRQEQGAGRDLAGRLRAAQLPDRGAGARPRRDRVLRSEELHLSRRLPHLRGRDRSARPAASRW